ncbi:alpha/beta hydrolase [Bradyrhizobium sp. CCBAU 051011]|uniref:alpha/beta hydrolase n=1 Tax=Bradyrhizobium sp. CCBAU 051011 TaxID=858422 RepID=UPI00137B3993|nr:alpha/beta fold hydrolase [Bradyrhizobium sp. CCBAU 051011]
MRSVVGADGYSLRYRVWPADEALRATLILLHGVMSHSGWFQPLADHLGEAGLKIIGADRRGSGLNEEGRGDAPSARMLVDDVRRIIAAERSEGRPVHLAGWCWGAVLAVNVAATCQQELASLVLIAPGLHPSEAVTAAMKRQDAIARHPHCGALAIPITEDMFTRGPHLAAIEADELRCRLITPRFHNIMRKLGVGAKLRLGQLDLPMLLVLAGTDEATDNFHTRRTFAALRRSAVTIKEICGSHGLQFEAPDQLADAVASFTAIVGDPADVRHAG